MPRVTQTEIDAYAYCIAFDAEGEPCEGMRQQPVRGLRVLTEVTFGDAGCSIGALAGLVENSSEQIHFADQADVACPTCGAHREITSQKTIVYRRQIGASGDLLEHRRALRRAAERNAQLDRMAEMMAQVAGNSVNESRLDAMAREIEELRAAQKADEQIIGPAAAGDGDKPAPARKAKAVA